MHKPQVRQESGSITSRADINRTPELKTQSSIRHLTFLSSDRPYTRSKTRNIDEFNVDYYIPGEFRAKNGDPLRSSCEVPDIRFEGHAEGALHCSCKVCTIDNMHIKKEIKPSPVTGFFQDFDFKHYAKNTPPEKDFIFVLRRLIPPKPIPYMIRLFIPETVAFFGGEAKFIVLTEKDKKLKYIRDRDRLSINAIRRFFHDYQKRKEVEISMFDDKETDRTVMIEIIESSMREKTPRPSTVRPKLKKGRTMIPMKADSEEARMKKEVGIVKYHDDTSTVLNEVELDEILLKRKNDPYWNKIQYLQLYVRTKEGIRTMQRVYFVYDTDKNDELFERARVEIRYLNGEIPRASEHYKPIHEEEKFEENLQQTDLNKYYLYLLMKIYHFLEIMWDIRITKMGGDFVKDTMGVIWLINISRLQYENLVSKNQNQKETPPFSKCFLPNVGEEVMANTRTEVSKPGTSDRMSQIMKNEFDKLKKIVGLNMKEVNENIQDVCDSQVTPKKFTGAKKGGAASDRMRGAAPQTPPKSLNNSRQISMLNTSSLTLIPIHQNKPGRATIGSIADREANQASKLVYLKRGSSLAKENRSSLKLNSINQDASRSQYISNIEILPITNDQGPSISTTRKEYQPVPVRPTKNIIQLLKSNRRESSLRRNTAIAQTSRRSHITEGSFNQQKSGLRSDRTSNLEASNAKSVEPAGSHSQWIKSLNDKIHKRISVQLSGKFQNN